MKKFVDVLKTAFSEWNNREARGWELLSPSTAFFRLLPF